MVRSAASIILLGAAAQAAPFPVPQLGGIGKMLGQIFRVLC